MSRVATNGFATGSFLPALWVIDEAAGSTSYATEASCQGPAPRTGTLKNIQAIVGPGTQDAGTQTWTLRKNGADTAITFTIVNTDAAALVIAVAGTLAVTKGDKLAWKMTNSGGTNDDRAAVVVMELDA